MPDGWSPDGTKIAFTSNSSDLVADDTNDAEDVFVKNLSTGVVKRVSTDAAGGQGSEGSANSVWSPDGKHVAFTSGAPDLVPQDTNGKEDAFVKDLSTGAIERISVTSDGKQADNDTIEVTWSRDGERALIVSAAGNLVPDDTNGWFDVFITDTP